MKEVKFGRMGCEVSSIGFGAWGIGSAGYGSVDKDDALKTIDSYISGGGNFIDTAIGYKKSEALLGEYFASHPGRREKIFLCSKTGSTSLKEIKEDIETSLKNLNTDYIDLYYLHNPPEDPREMEKVISIYESLKHEGLIHGIGASIKGPSVTKETQQLCLQYIRTGKIDAIQLIFSIFRQSNRMVFDEAHKKGVALVGRTALESGMLTGKYKPGHQFPESDHRSRWSRTGLDNILIAAEKLNQNLEKDFDSLSQKALRFAYDEPLLTNIIVGATNPVQMDNNLSLIEKPSPPVHWRDKLIEEYKGNYDLGNF